MGVEFRCRHRPLAEALAARARTLTTTERGAAKAELREARAERYPVPDDAVWVPFDLYSATRRVLSLEQMAAVPGFTSTSASRIAEVTCPRCGETVIVSTDQAVG